MLSDCLITVEWSLFVLLTPVAAMLTAYRQDCALPGFSCLGEAGPAVESRPALSNFTFDRLLVGLLGNGHRIDRIFTTWLPELRGASFYVPEHIKRALLVCSGTHR